MRPLRAKPPRELTAAAVALLLAVPLGCGGSASSTSGSSSQTPPQPAPAPTVTLTQEDKQVWAPGPAPPGIPTLLYHGIGPRSDFADPADAEYAITPEDFAKQLALLKHAGYHTVTLEQFAGYVEGRSETLPSRPLLITFDDALDDSWVNGDAALEREGYTATMFADAYRVNSHAEGYLTWGELKTMAASGRWDIQLHSYLGHEYIHYGPGTQDYGAYYAYREEHESLDGWRKRTFGDITEGADKLHEELPGEQPLAFAPPYGNYGQDGTNDPQIPPELLSGLLDRYRIVFVQSKCMFSTPHEQEPLGRLQLEHATTGGELHDKLITSC